MEVIRELSVKETFVGSSNRERERERGRERGGEKQRQRTRENNNNTDKTLVKRLLASLFQIENSLGSKKKK